MAQERPEKISDLRESTSIGSEFLVPVADAGVQTYKVPVSDLVPEVDVRQYGTLGTTDDTSVFTRALDATPTGGVLVIPAGVTVTCEGVTISDKEVRGPGTLKYKANASSAMMTLSGGARLTNLNIDGNRSNQTGSQSAILTSAATGVRIVGCRFYSFRARGILTSVADSPNGLISGCEFDGFGATGISCDAVCIRSPGWTVSDSWWNDLDDGHCIRLGLFNGDATTTPVTGTIITGCHFQNTNHVGITCEIYAQDTTVTGCEFNDLEQAIKAESVGSVVWGITFTNNLVRTIAISTAFNLQVPEVNFSNNRCYDCAGGVLLGERAICDRNYLENVGEAASNASIVLGSGNSRASGNIIYAAPFVGIRMAGAGNLVTDNQIDGNSVTQIGINVVSTSTVGRVVGNRIINQTGNAISFSSGANFDSMQVRDNYDASGPLVITIVKTISSGVIGCPLSEGTFTIATEGGAATDDLDTITATTGMPIGRCIVLRPNSNSQDPTLKHGTGNLHLVGSADFAMLTSAYHIGLQWSGTFWQEMWRSTT